jgi:hypothetical protein
MTINFDRVWYLSCERTWQDGKLAAYDDIWRLICESNQLEFIGIKNHVLISNVQQVTYRKQGRDFVNNWVKVEYDDKVAFFADGRLLGWAGIFGGTRKILTAVRHLSPGTGSDRV